MELKIKLLFIIAASMAFASRVAAQAPPCGDFTIFEDGTPALSEEVNCNFELHADSIDDNRRESLRNKQAITGIETQVGQLLPSQIIQVAKAGGDFTTLSDAMDSIQDASLQSPYLIKIAPGTYAEPSSTTIKSNVYVEGAGPGLTTLTCDDANNCTNLLYINLTGRSKISALTLIQSGSSKTAIRIFGSQTDCRVDIEDVEVTINTTGGTNAAIAAQQCGEVVIDGINVAMDGTGSSYGVDLYNVLKATVVNSDIAVKKNSGDASSFTTGIYSDVQELDIRNTRISAIRGRSARAVHAPSGGQIVVRDSELEASSGIDDNYGIRLFNTSAYITGSTLGAGGSQGAAKFFAQVDGSSAFVRMSGSLISNGTAACYKGPGERCFYCRDIHDIFVTRSYDEFCEVVLPDTP